MIAGRRMLVLSALLVASGCSAALPPAPSEDPGTTASAEPAATIPAIAKGEPGMRCNGQGMRFSAAALTGGPTIGEFGVDDAAAALLRVLAEDASLPREGWRRVAQGPEGILFIADSRDPLDPGWVMVSLALDGGRWRVDSIGACAVSPDFPEGIQVGEWWLDPDARPPGARDRTISALVGERACASGRPPVGRVLPPLIVYEDDSVVVTFGVRMLPGGQDCPGAPPAPVRFELEEPLGERRLLDGGVFPPADASRPPDER